MFINVQKIHITNSWRTRSTLPTSAAKAVKVGFSSGEVNLFSNGKSLLVTKEEAVKGFVFLVKKKIIITGGNPFIALPRDWVSRYASGEYITAEYTKKGITYRAFNEKEFKGYDLSETDL